MNLRKSAILGARVSLTIVLIVITYLKTARLPSEPGGAVDANLNHLLAIYVLTLLTDFSFAAS